MNNGAIVIKAKNRDEAIEAASDPKVITEPDSIVVRSVRFLKDNVHFQTFVRKIIDKEIESERKNLELEQDPIKMYRSQGYIKALEKIKDLERFQKIYQSKVERNNGKKESK